LRRKASVATALRWAGAAATAGAAWLGLGLILADEDPAAILGLIAALVALAGGSAARAGSRPAVLRGLPCLLPILVARWAAGSLGAALAAGCVAAGWWLRVCPSDLILVLALFGGAVAALVSPSGHLVVAFVVLGVLTVAIGPALAGARRRLRLIVALRNAGEGRDHEVVR
jgi:hypothetical protein